MYGAAVGGGAGRRRNWANRRVAAAEAVELVVVVLLLQVLLVVLVEMVVVVVVVERLVLDVLVAAGCYHATEARAVVVHNTVDAGRILQRSHTDSCGFVEKRRTDAV